MWEYCIAFNNKNEAQIFKNSICNTIKLYNGVATILFVENFVKVLVAVPNKNAERITKFLTEKIAESILLNYKKDFILSRLNFSFSQKINMQIFLKALIVFDSDTYKELMNKLNVLKEAHDKYVSGNKDTSYLLDELSDKRHKDSFGKIIISYESSSNNKIDKPNTIDKRMKNLYKKYDLVGEEFDFDEQKENLSSLISIIDEEILNYDIKKNNLNFPKSESQPVKKKGKFSIFG